MSGITGNQSSKAGMVEYVLVFKDNAPPKEHQFFAVSDEHAIDLMQKQYPALAWAMYRLEHEQRQKVHEYMGGLPPQNRPSDQPNA